MSLLSLGSDRRERRGVTGVPVLMTGQVPQHLSLPCDLTGQNLREHSALGINSFGTFPPPPVKLLILIFRNFALGFRRPWTL